ncbi:helix-turn-helix transcriptional regulator [Pseudoclavibacter sp. CFCC 14310]|uniref:helix-turn-helix domain-containing protein n=1 Tax=Pseudoclavibacter sp. CFCC 14310 TaxID=2615180 RepID=UPI0013017C2D|nr:helix-turn-helix transcriptional regulator [Pseudoclavibacter sp. CFCC 14310]KAB1646203.1 helix-turn-helix transcriptional regulator [Pseudoclavibacter sp. CFCC 14310]
MSIGQQIREARDERGLTQTELAAQAGVSRPTVARVELGVAISVATLSRLADVLGMEVSLVRAKGRPARRNNPIGSSGPLTFD